MVLPNTGGEKTEKQGCERAARRMCGTCTQEYSKMYGKCKMQYLGCEKSLLLEHLVLVYLPQGCENEKILVLFSQQLGSAVTILEVPQDAKLRSDLGA
jgi:hypothetical protein